MTDSTTPAGAPVPATPATGAPVAATPAASAPAPATSQASDDTTAEQTTSTPPSDAGEGADTSATSSTATPPAPPVPSTTTTTTGAVGDASAPAPATSLVDSLDNAARKVREEELGIENMADELKDYILNVIDNGTPVARDWVKHVLTYLKSMGPNTPNTVATGVVHQEAFFREMMSALDNYVGNEFHVMMNCVLGIINHAKADGAFAMNLWARFIPDWRLGDVARQQFLALIHVFRTASDGATRKLAIKQIDLDKAFANLLPATREKLETYFRS